MDKRKTALALVACGSLFIGSGCTRTSDGSIVMKTSHMPSMFARRSDPPAAERDQRITPAEPAPRQQASAPRPRPGRALPPVGAWKMQPVKAPFERSDPEKPLDCRDETSAEGRVRVVCQ